MTKPSRVGQYSLSVRSAKEVGFIGDEVDLLVRQGQTWEITGAMSQPDGTPYDLTACSVRGQVRRHPADTTVVVELLGVITDAARGTYTVSLTDAQTAAITAGDSMYDAESEYVYDLELTDAIGRVLPIMWGRFRVHREVTR